MRPKNASSWAAVLYQHHGRQWLIEKRAALQSPLLGGRFGARALHGFVATRWRDGVSYAEATQVRVPHRQMDELVN